MFIAISFRDHGTTRDVFAATRFRLQIDEFPQQLQGVQIDSWPILEHQALAASRIQHPTRNNESQAIFKLDDDRRFLPGPEPADDLHLVIHERVISISDTAGTKLMSSVLIRYGIALPRISWRTARTSAPSRNYWGTRMSAPP